MRAIGTTDAVTTCDCCGKAGLKLTVAMETSAGEIVHYGSTCARRNSGKTSKQIKLEIDAAKVERLRAARAAWRAHPANVAYQTKLAARDRYNASRPFSERLHGRSAAEFVWPEWCAYREAIKTLAAEFGVNAGQVD